MRELPPQQRSMLALHYPVAGPLCELRPGVSQVLCKALYWLHVAHARGHDQCAAVARFASLDPERVKIQDSDEGRRLRAALRGSHAL
ncbi:hypothetical protein [Streptomyces sp. WM6378]|uniref:hypothetical protein n=1 Tax=Streptomyces sp. WM6378 TaxID=1415557 RepID=UPI000ACA91DD|nr:hypothetical protein [Streptomyces sp. WM6378]